MYSQSCSGTRYLAGAGLELIDLPQPMLPECWEKRRALPHPDEPLRTQELENYILVGHISVNKTWVEHTHIQFKGYLD